MGGEGYRADYLGAGGHGIFKNFGGSIVYDAMVIGFEFDADAGEGFLVLVGHMWESGILNDELGIIKKPREDVASKNCYLSCQ